MSETTAEKFSSAMKQQTWTDHDAAEYTNYMQALLEGKLTKNDYADMVAQHYFAYVVIEDAAKKYKDDPTISRFHPDALNRLESLEKDLEFLYGPDWKNKIKANEGTEEYVARLKEVIYDWPGGFVAHHYTRYLGDLSGGQIIKAAVEKAYDLPNQEATHFYYFPGIPDYKQFKIDYRDGLDAAPWDDAEKQKVIDEVNKAYQLNTKVLVDCGKVAEAFQG